MEKITKMTDTKKTRLKNLIKELRNNGVKNPVYYARLAYDELGFNTKKETVKVKAIELSENN